MGSDEQMNFFYLNKNIENSELKKFTGLQQFSELSIQKTPLLKMIQGSLNNEFTFHAINSVDEISDAKKEIIVWSSNIIYKNELLQTLFCKKLLSSYFGLFFGSKKSFIFKGQIDELNSILYSDKEIITYKRIIKLIADDNLITINTLWDLKKIALHEPHSRYFNDLKVSQNIIIKKSSNKNKIIAEFTFLDSLPREIQKYYVTVSNIQIEGEKAQYTMEKINGIDISMQYINKGFSVDSMQNIFDELEIYFKLISKFKGLSIESPYNFITSKNAIRLAELESWDGFNQLNLFISNHTTFSGIKNLFDKSNEILGKSKSLLNNSEGLISHGDLCFSNILIDEKDCKLVFIDPRGGEINNNFRTPYYDLAKLCHSLLGGYDHIINNVAEIQFDQSMQATILFNQNLMEYEKVFSSFVENLGMNYSLVREIEISLFLSMLPLHIDSTKKVNMLALRASELILAAEK